MPDLSLAMTSLNTLAELGRAGAAALAQKKDDAAAAAPPSPDVDVLHKHVWKRLSELTDRVGVLEAESQLLRSECNKLRGEVGERTRELNDVRERSTYELLKAKRTVKTLSGQLSASERQKSNLLLAQAGVKQREALASMRRTVLRMTHVYLGSAFGLWQRAVARAEAAEMTAAFNAKLKKIQGGHGVAKLQRLAATLRGVTRADVFEAWRSLSDAQGAATRAAADLVRRTILRMIHVALFMGFGRWRRACDAMVLAEAKAKMAAFQKGQGLEKLKRIGAQWQGAGMVQVFRAWARFARKNGASAQVRELERALAASKKGEGIQRLRRLAVLLKGGPNDEDCFLEWRAILRDRKAAARSTAAAIETMNRFARRLLHRKLAQGHMLWRRYVDAAQVREAQRQMAAFQRGQGIGKLRRIAAQLRGVTPRTVFEAWLDVVLEKHSAAGLCRRVLLKMILVQLSLGFGTWRRRVDELKQDEMQRRFDTFRKSQGEEKLRRLGRAIAGDGLQAHLRAWARVAAKRRADMMREEDAAGDAVRRRAEAVAKLRRLAATMFGHSINIVFRSWRRHASQSRRAAALIKRTVGKMIHVLLSLGFSTWRRRVDELLRDEMQRRFDAFRKSQGEEVLRRVGRAIRGSGLRVVLQEWNQAAARLIEDRRRAEEADRDGDGDGDDAARQRQLDADVAAMRAEMARFKYDQGVAILQRIGAALRGASQVAVFEAWRQVASARRAAAALCRRTMLKMLQVQLSLGFNTWRSRVDAAKLAEVEARIAGFRRAHGEEKMRRIGAALRLSGAPLSAVFAAWHRTIGGSKMDRQASQVEALRIVVRRLEFRLAQAEADKVTMQVEIRRLRALATVTLAVRGSASFVTTGPGSAASASTSPAWSSHRRSSRQGTSTKAKNEIRASVPPSASISPRAQAAAARRRASRAKIVGGGGGADDGELGRKSASTGWETTGADSTSTSTSMDADVEVAGVGITAAAVASMRRQALWAKQEVVRLQTKVVEANVEAEQWKERAKSNRLQVELLHLRAAASAETQLRSSKRPRKQRRGQGDVPVQSYHQHEAKVEELLEATLGVKATELQHRQQRSVAFTTTENGHPPSAMTTAATTPRTRKSGNRLLDDNNERIDGHGVRGSYNVDLSPSPTRPTVQRDEEQQRRRQDRWSRGKSPRAAAAHVVLVEAEGGVHVAAAAGDAAAAAVAAAAAGGVTEYDGPS